jgi:anti-anti-sigma regulatory factor
LTYKIQRSMKAGTIVFALSGEMDNEHMERLQELLDTEEHSRILLDLKDVTVVGREAVQFLARVEIAGVRFVNCPDYVRSWIVAENQGTESA